jgi:secreted trypsin-like serine protease
MPSLNFQAFMMTIIISNVRVTFHNFNHFIFQSDDGGALVYLESDGVHTQVGIVSFGSETGCEHEYPATFTRVNRYLCWIVANIDMNFYFCP